MFTMHIYTSLTPLSTFRNHQMRFPRSWWRGGCPEAYLAQGQRVLPKELVVEAVLL